jgi:hypothetical protein
MSVSLGIFPAGLSGEYLPWSWDSHIGTVLLPVVAVITFFTVPFGKDPTKSIQTLIFGALILMTNMVR